MVFLLLLINSSQFAHLLVLLDLQGEGRGTDTQLGRARLTAYQGLFERHALSLLLLKVALVSHDRSALNLINQLFVQTLEDMDCSEELELYCIVLDPVFELTYS